MNIESSFLHIGLFFVAVLANMLSAFSGGGAGLIQLPALVLLGMPFPEALATHKLASVALGVGASTRYISEKNLKIPLAIFILSCGLPGVLLGAKSAILIPEKVATFFLGLLTLFIAIFSSRKNKFRRSNRKLSLDLLQKIIGGFVLFFIGFLNGSLTSGTGLLVTMWLVYWFNLTYANAIAYTLILVGVAWNGTGALTLGLNAQIQWEWIPVLISGSLIGGYLGAHLSILKGESLVKKAFELLTLIMGLSLVARSF